MTIESTKPGAPPDPGAPEEVRDTDDTRPMVTQGPAAAQPAEDLDAKVAEHAPHLLDDRESAATQAVRVIQEVLGAKPEALVGLVDKFVKGLASKHKRVVQVSADALPAIAKIAPARVAKHMDALKASYAALTPVAKDGIVRALTNLCVASVAYQKRLEPTLSQALGEAEPKTLQRWTEIILPALKGEPHASARTVVEKRIYDLPRPIAQKIADQLGIKLRPQR